MLIKPSLYCLLCCCWISAVHGQDNPSKEQAELVDGLLDLLNEPAPAKSQPSPAAPILPVPEPGRAGGKSNLSAGHPMQSLRKNMLTAAEYLSQGYVNQQTRQVQSDIVVQLDELIAQLEQANTAQQPQPQSEQQQSQSSEQPESPAPQTQPPNSAAAPTGPTADNPQPESTADGQAPSTPGQQGRQANPTVDLVDPKTLQQDVWGQLPEQVRKQMQSRMVERFLPSYRQQIEAYFQALIEGPE